MIKRSFDIIMSSILIIFLSPFFIPVIIILKLTGEGHIFFSQTRVGKQGKKFSLYKFATMLKESPNIGTRNLTIKDDPRILPFGTILRKTKINELPQLLNVLIGDMSFVGPRPLTSDHFESIPEEFKKKIKQLRPGITSIGSIIFRDEEKFKSNNDENYVIEFYQEEIIPYKASLELWYYWNKSLRIDLLILILTIFSILIPGNNYCNTFFKKIPKHPLFNPA